MRWLFAILMLMVSITLVQGNSYSTQVDNGVTIVVVDDDVGFVNAPNITYENCDNGIGMIWNFSIIPGDQEFGPAAITLMNAEESWCSELTYDCLVDRRDYPLKYPLINNSFSSYDLSSLTNCLIGNSTYCDSFS